METNRSRTPFGHLTNHTNGGAESVPNSPSANNNNKQCKRERERARYAAMSQEEKNAKNQRRREARQKKKELDALHISGATVKLRKESEYQNPMETNGSPAPFGDLTNHTNGGVESESNLQSANNSTEHHKWERERTRYAAMSQEEKNVRNLRKREVRHKNKVGGAVEPSRCNFSACAVGNRVVLFGGEGVNMQPMNDTFVLDLNASNPEWRHINVSAAPPGRWGHTLSCLNGSWLVVFGGCGRQGLLNDVFMLDLDAKQPTWREIPGVAPPVPRSWHSSCTLDGTKLVVSGGCADSGVLLSDTYLLDVTMDRPVWREVPASWKPPSRLGHSMSVYGGRKILMFGGLAKSGPLRLRSSDVYTMDLSEEEPCWRCLTGSGMPGAGNPAGAGPPPRLDHVAVSLPGGRILIFGGSVAGLHSASQLYLLDPTEEKPTWRILNVPGRPPRFAWGHSTCVVGGTKAIVLGGQTGEEWMLTEIHELSLASNSV